MMGLYAPLTICYKYSRTFQVSEMESLLGRRPIPGNLGDGMLQSSRWLLVRNEGRWVRGTSVRVYIRTALHGTFSQFRTHPQESREGALSAYD